MSPYAHIHLYYVLLTILFLCVISYMFLYNKRSKDRQKSIENHGTPIVGKEAGIAQAQESLKQERRRRDRSV